MQIEQTVLENGLRVVTAHLPGFDSAAVGAFVNAGARCETAENGGIAHFLEHMAFKGTSSRSALQIATEVEVLGSHVNAFTSQSMTAYFVTGLNTNMDQAIAILGDVLTDSVYDPKEIATEKGVILQEISRHFDNPGAVAYDGFGAVAYPDQAIGRPILGTSEFIRSVEREHFLDFVKANYFAQNMVVIGSGDIEHKRFVDKVAAAFARLPSRNEEVTPAAARYAGGYIRNTENNFKQVTCLMGLKSVGDRAASSHAHALLGSVLGGGMSAPLFQEVREKRGLVYAIHSGTHSGDDHGELIVSAGTTAEHVEQVLTLSCAEILKASQQISAHDLDRARNGMLVALATAKERPFTMARGLADALFTHGRLIEPTEFMARVRAVTLDDVKAAAAEVVTSTPTISLVGPVPDAPYEDMVKSALRH